MKKLLLFVVLLALGAGGYYYYWSLKHGPSGALAAAAAAVQTHDMATFEKYVDVTSVTSHLVDDVTQNSMLTSLVPGGGLVMGGAMRLLKPTLAKAAHKEVQRYVETGSLEAAAEAAPKRLVNISLTGLASKIVGPDSQFKGVKYTREEGDNAFVGLEISQPKYDTTMVVEVKMRRQGDHWQMTQITNSGELLSNVALLEKKRLIGGQ